MNARSLMLTASFVSYLLGFLGMLLSITKSDLGDFGYALELGGSLYLISILMMYFDLARKSKIPSVSKQRWFVFITFTPIGVPFYYLKAFGDEAQDSHARRNERNPNA